MGHAVASMCGRTDFFQNLLQQYGDDFVKLVLSQKAKMQLEEKFVQIIAKIREYVTIFQMKVNGIVDSKLKRLNQKFEEVKAKVNSVIPGGIPFLQRQKGKSINEFSGFNDITNQIDSIRDKTLSQVHSQRDQVENQLLQKKNFLYQQIQNQRPKVPLYQDLPQDVRQKILLKAQKQFKEQIDKKQRQVDGKCDQSFNQEFGKMDQYLNKLNPDSILEDLVERSVTDMVKKTLGNGAGGVIGNIAGKIF